MERGRVGLNGPLMARARPPRDVPPERGRVGLNGPLMARARPPHDVPPVKVHSERTAE